MVLATVADAIVVRQSGGAPDRLTSRIPSGPLACFGHVPCNAGNMFPVSLPTECWESIVQGVLGPLRPQQAHDAVGYGIVEELAGGVVLRAWRLSERAFRQRTFGLAARVNPF